MKRWFARVADFFQVFFKVALYEAMIDHHSYTHNLSSCEIEALKEI